MEPAIMTADGNFSRQMENRQPQQLRIDSGPLSATYKFADIPQDRWKQLVREKRDFLATNIKYDCRCLIKFCEEANEVWETLDYASAADMIRNGYELDPQQIELAIAWLKINGTDAAIGIDSVKEQIASAKADPLPLEDQTVEPRNPGGKNQHTKEPRSIDNINRPRGGTDTNYTLRRLARDNPEMLDRIEAGELSVNAAAIQAGIRKKPTQSEVCVRAFDKLDRDQQAEVCRLLVAKLGGDV